MTDTAPRPTVDDLLNRLAQRLAKPTVTRIHNALESALTPVAQQRGTTYGQLELGQIPDMFIRRRMLAMKNMGAKTIDQLVPFLLDLGFIPPDTPTELLAKRGAPGRSRPTQAAKVSGRPLFLRVGEKLMQATAQEAAREGVSVAEWWRHAARQRLGWPEGSEET